LFFGENYILVNEYVEWWKTKMQIEKKLIALSVLAVAIGIATIVPLEYLMGAEAQAKAELVKVEPMLNVNVTYAYCELDKTVSNSTMTLYGARLGAVANFTLTPTTLKTADAQIEYYKFAVSSDQGPIVDLGYYISVEKAGITSGASGTGTIWFANGLTYNGPPSNGGQNINWDAWQPSSVVGFASDYIFGTDADDVPQAVIDLRNAQTLYIEVTKVSTVTVKGDVTVTTPASSEVLQRITLTKTDYGFIYGSYADGTLPIPMWVPD
jgi:hypothetical protein